MAVKTDIEIAREAKKKPIQEIGAKLGIPTEHLLPYGHDKAKVGQAFIKSIADRPKGVYGRLRAVRPGDGDEREFQRLADMEWIRRGRTA